MISKRYSSLIIILVMVFFVAHANVQIVSVEQGAGNDFVTTFSSKQQALFYGRSDLDVSQSVIRRVDLDTLTPEAVSLNASFDYSFFSAPSVVEFEGLEYLYYVTSARFWGNQAQLFRASLSEIESKELVHLPGNYGAYSIIRIVTLDDGSLGTVFRAGRSQLFFSRSEDGLTFIDPVQFAVGTMPAIASFSNGAVLVSYQNGPSINEMGGRLQVSSDIGQNWSDVISLPHLGNIHDLSPVRRRDGNIDVYYSAAGGNKRLGIYRVCVTEALKFGPREQLMSSELVHAAKSTFHHTDRGLLLTFASQTDDLVEGNLSMKWMTSEAPTCPESE